LAFVFIPGKTRDGDVDTGTAVGVIFPNCGFPRTQSGLVDRLISDECHWFKGMLTRMNGCNTIAYMASLTLRISDSLERQLVAASKERGISKSDIAREAIERDLRVEAWRKLRDQFRPNLEAQGLFTEEDVLRRLDEKQ
jgi:predicted transcriptional regulator